MMKIETAAEACAALAILIAAADELGSDEEGRFLFDTVATLPMFEELDHDGFARLLGSVADGLYSSFPMDGNRVSPDGVGQLVGMIRDALPTESRVEALDAAVGLAQSDGVTTIEALLLQRLCEGLEIDSESRTRLLDRVARA